MTVKRKMHVRSKMKSDNPFYGNKCVGIPDHYVGNMANYPPLAGRRWPVGYHLQIKKSNGQQLFRFNDGLLLLPFDLDIAPLWIIHGKKLVTSNHSLGCILRSFHTTAKNLDQRENNVKTMNERS